MEKSLMEGEVSILEVCLEMSEVVRYINCVEVKQYQWFDEVEIWTNYDVEESTMLKEETDRWNFIPLLVFFQ